MKSKNIGFLFLAGLFLLGFSVFAYSQWQQYKMEQLKKKAEKSDKTDFEELSQIPLHQFKTKIKSSADTPSAQKVVNYADVKLVKNVELRGSDNYLKILDVYIDALEAEKYSDKTKCGKISISLIGNLKYLINNYKNLYTDGFESRLAKINTFISNNCLEQDYFARKYANLIEINKEVGTSELIPITFYSRVAEDLEKNRYKTTTSVRNIIYNNLPKDRSTFYPTKKSDQEIRNMTKEEFMKYERDLYIELIEQEKGKENPNKDKISKWETILSKRYGIAFDNK